MFGSQKEIASCLMSMNVPRISPFGTVYYVDPDNGSAAYNGLSPSKAKATITTALALCSDGDTILLTGSLTESIVVDSYADGPHFITIQGASDSIRLPSWTGDGTKALVQLRGHGWVFKNIRFVVPAGYDGLYLEMEFQGAAGAYQTKVEDCYFFGPSATKAAIELYGAPNACIIKNCWFDYFPTGTGIKCSNTDQACPFRCMIIGNRFTECLNQIDMYGSRGCMYIDNIFPGQGHVVATVKHLYLNPTNSDDNVVYRNFLGGDYDLDANSYSPGSNDSWIGNFAEDITACTSGITLAVPA